MARSRKRNYKKAFGTAQSIYQTGKMAYNAYKRLRPSTSSRTATRTKSQMVTFQKDSQRQYRFKKMPYRKKRAWKKFSGKVKSVEAAGRGKQTLIINDAFTGASTDSQTQIVSEVNLYSNNADLNGGNDQDAILNEVSNWNTNYDPASKNEQPFNTQERTRLRVGMHHANIDITYTNTGETPLEVDFYQLVHKMSKYPFVDGSNVISLESAQSLYNASIHAGQKLEYINNDYTGKSIGQDVLLNKRGITPFNCSGINRVAGGKIMNKTKVIISPGNSVTRRYTDNKHRYISSHDDLIKNRYSKHTTTYLAIAKSTNPLLLGGLRTSFTKNYSWTVEGQKVPRMTYINGLSVGGLNYAQDFNQPQ